MALKVSRLFYYPVKSLAGVETDALEHTPRGPAWDREWMLVDAAGGFLSQRALPRMCLIRPAVDAASLTLSFPDRPALAVSLTTRGKPRRAAVVWGDPGRAVDEGDEAAAVLSDFLAAPCRLVRYARGFRRRHGTAFADGYPLLVVNAASLDDLSARAGRAFELERFRPNIVVSGARAWAEDGWKSLKRGRLTLRAVKPCARCAITTVDPATGRTGPEPLRTLAGFRRGADGGVLFGVNCAVTGPGTLRIGDILSVAGLPTDRSAGGVPRASGP